MSEPGWALCLLLIRGIYSTGQESMWLWGGGLSAQIQVNYQQVDQSPSYGREGTQAPGKTLMGDKSFSEGK